ncbi:MAG: hypothetical protein PHE84_09025 [bacterium]|nr:hypothetical protein [bacterium]
MKKGILLLPLLFWFVFCLFPAPAPGAEVTRSFIERLTNNTDLADQESLIRAVVKNPKKYKPELLSYLKKPRNLDNEDEQPSSAVLYLVGFSRDKDYFPYLYPLLKTQYAKDSCIYFCGLVFAAVLTCPDKKHFDYRSHLQPIKDFSFWLNRFLNDKPSATLQKRKDAALAKFVAADRRGRFQAAKLLDYPARKLVGIAKSGTDREQQINAAIALEYLGESTETATDLLVLAIQGPVDETDRFVGACYRGIFNILIRTKRNHLAGN